MLRRVLIVAVVLPACAPSEPSDLLSEAQHAGVQALAELTGESVDTLRQEPCVIGCAGAALAGCQDVKEVCDTALAAPFAGIWITCTEAVQSACGGTVGLGFCAHSCRARSGRS
ncbi:MAG: hypothetical protein QM820_44790 [Minicystis sp.]